MKNQNDVDIITYAKNQYNEIFDMSYECDFKTKEDIVKLLEEYPHSYMCEWHYCCYRLYQNCWQDLTEEGIWGLTQEEVNACILNVFTSELLKKCKNENRMFSCRHNNDVCVLIVTRDLENKSDYLICFSKEEQ